ncbi:MAG: NUDIX domain-containing protein [Alkalilacustris sp.]
MPRPVRLAVRALILHEERLLVVNAWPGGRSDLWCAPGGGVEPGRSLPDNLIREVAEETGLHIAVGPPCLVNEFHDPGGDFHQCDIYFRARITGGLVHGAPDPGWRDPAGVVDRRRFVSEAELRALRFKPDSLPDVAWRRGMGYDPLEPIIR